MGTREAEGEEQVKVATKVGATLVAIALVVGVGQFYQGETGKFPGQTTNSEEGRDVEVRAEWKPSRPVKISWLIGADANSEQVISGRWRRKGTLPRGAKIQVSIADIDAVGTGWWKKCAIKINGGFADEEIVDFGAPVACSATVQ